LQQTWLLACATLAPTSAQTKDGLTALAYANAEDRPGVVNVLLDRGAGTLEQILKVSIKGFTPLSMAIAGGHEKIAVLLLQRLVQCAGFDISQPLAGLRKGLPLLAAAASKGMGDLIELALDSGAPVNATGEYGSAASQAASKGHLQILSLLHRRGADLTLGACLANAAAVEHVHTFKKLLKLGVNVNSLSAGHTLPAVFVATARAQLAAVEALLAAGADVPLLQQNSLLASVCRRLDDTVAAQMLKLLLPRCGKYEAVPRISEDSTAFAYAVSAGKLQAARLLASAGANVMYVDEQGHNAVHRAASGSSLEMVQWVVSLGVDPRARARDGSLPLHAACAQVPARADMIEYLLNVPGGAAVADLKVVDTNGSTPLHVAASSGSEVAVEALLRRGADVKAVDYNCATPLMHAKTALVVKLLLAAGADAAAVDMVCCTALHYFARNNVAAGAVCLLLKAGTDPTATAINRATAADLAGNKGHTALQSLLLRATDDYRKAHPVAASAVDHSVVNRCDCTGAVAAASGSTAVAVPAATAVAVPAVAAAAATVAPKRESLCSSSELSSAESSKQ
jgi:uncharacterized protein